jgi:PPOX class probable F420-dependent enzyme
MSSRPSDIDTKKGTRDMDLRMTAEERLAFLTEVPRVGVLSVDAPDRAPVASPVWFTVEPDGAIAFSVGTESQKTRLLRAAGRATMCVQSETAPYSYVSAEGAVEELGSSTDESRLDRAQQYLGDELGDAYFASTRDEPNLTFALRPQRWASVDYSKMF